MPVVAATAEEGLKFAAIPAVEAVLVDFDMPGVNGLELMGWFFHSKAWRAMHGQDGGEEGTDNSFAAQGFDNIGAWILGRNMFGPVRGPWPDESWRGWWGDDPPYHVPVFVLTHYPRAPLKMAGGTQETVDFVAIRIARIRAGAHLDAGLRDGDRRKGLRRHDRALRALREGRRGPLLRRADFRRTLIHDRRGGKHREHPCGTIRQKSGRTRRRVPCRKCCRRPLGSNRISPTHRS